MNQLKDSVTNFFTQHLEVNVSRYDETFLKNTLKKRINETGCATVDEYFELLTHSELENQILIDTLQISYSAFFRNTLTYSVLENIVIPDLLDQRINSQIRIWSAACAAGQEPYSMAILFEEALIGNKKNNRYRIFATDRDDNQIYLAEKGNYHVSALNQTSMLLANKWYKRSGEFYTIKPSLKENIDFSVYDLFDEKHSSPPASIYGNFDVVFCANLLFYYKKDYRIQIINKIVKSMTHEGLLITGETERDILLKMNFKEVYPKSAIFSIK